MTAALELTSVSASYGPFRALFDVSFEIAQGEALALVGANGSGKTTVARVVSGLVKPDDGRVRINGEDFTGKRAYEYARAGLAHAPEGRSVFATLSVEENLTLSFRRVHGRKGVKQSLERAYEMFPVLGRRKNQTAGTLSGGEQRMLSLARVLVELPKVMVADELSLGLAPIIVDELYESLGRLRAEGTSLLIVEQQVVHALRLCDRVAILDHGTITWTGASEEATQVVTSAFDPTAHEATAPAAPAASRRRTGQIKPA